jgi:hypothetical protein
MGIEPTFEAWEAFASPGGFNGISCCPVEKAKRSPSENFCRRPYYAVLPSPAPGTAVGEDPPEPPLYRLKKSSEILSRSVLA